MNGRRPRADSPSFNDTQSRLAAMDSPQGQGQGEEDENTDGAWGVIRRYDKHRQAGTAPLAMDWIKATYDDAVEYTAVTKSLRGGLLMMGAVGILGGSVMLWMGFGVVSFGDWTSAVMGFVLIMIGLTMMTYLVMLGVRLELFSPEDAPTLFDRKHRKIYRLSRDSQPGFAGLFKPWPLVPSIFEWDLTDCEHRAELVTTGSTAYRQHALVFILRRSATDPTVVDEFQLGNALVLNDALADGVWEHIRRFMEEHGPALPPGQKKLADRAAPSSWWQSMGAVGPFGPKYFDWWRDSFGIALISHIGLPVALPMNILWGTGNWLSYKTARPVVWPAEIVQAIGPKRLG